MHQTPTGHEGSAEGAGLKYDFCLPLATPDAENRKALVVLLGAAGSTGRARRARRTFALLDLAAEHVADEL